MLQKIIASYQEPSLKLQKYIKMYWTAYNPTNDNIEMPIVPDGSIDIICLNGSIYLSGLMESAHVITIAPEDRFFCIRFQPYALALLLNEDISKFNDKKTPLEELNKVLASLPPKNP